jgi:hypothetical protein
LLKSGNCGCNWRKKLEGFECWHLFRTWVLTSSTLDTKAEYGT